MRSKRGVVDQTITSVVVLFATFFLMAVFVVVSSNVGALRGSVSGGEVIGVFQEHVDSQVLMDLFFAETITIDGEDLLLQELILSSASLSGEERTRILEQVAEVFEEKYSCNGKNHLVIEQSRIEDNSIEQRRTVQVLLDLPRKPDLIPVGNFIENDSGYQAPEPDSYERTLLSESGTTLKAFMLEVTQC